MGTATTREGGGERGKRLTKMALEGRTPTSSLRKEFEATRMKRQKERARAEVAADKQAHAFENKSESQNPEEEKK